MCLFQVSPFTSSAVLYSASTICPYFHSAFILLNVRMRLVLDPFSPTKRGIADNHFGMPQCETKSCLAGHQPDLHLAYDP